MLVFYFLDLWVTVPASWDGMKTYYVTFVIVPYVTKIFFFFFT